MAASASSYGGWLDWSRLPDFAPLLPLYERAPEETLAAFTVLLNLRGERRWRDLHVSLLDACGLPEAAGVLACVRGRPAAQQPLETVVPVRACRTLSMAWLVGVLERLAPANSFTLAVLDTDSTVVYYRMHRGLVPPRDAASVSGATALGDDDDDNI